MPRRSPFTVLCTQLSRLSPSPRADLHVHTTASDGEFSPSQVVAFARQAGLSAVAITDHDTLAGVREAQESVPPDSSLEVITGVEISTLFDRREVHLLGYFVRLDCAKLNARLDDICESRRERFNDYLRLLEHDGFPIPHDRAKAMAAASASLGRRHVARLLTTAGLARNTAEAFHRILSRTSRRVQPKRLAPIEEAIALLKEAGGIASLAHPSPELTDEHLRTLAGYGLRALEVDYPWGRKSPAARWREAARRHGFAVTGGSDCHGPHPESRRIGSHGITPAALEGLRRL